MRESLRLGYDGRRTPTRVRRSYQLGRKTGGSGELHRPWFAESVDETGGVSSALVEDPPND
jgi:hypothetical protein